MMTLRQESPARELEIHSRRPVCEVNLIIVRWRTFSTCPRAGCARNVSCYAIIPTTASASDLIVTLRALKDDPSVLCVLCCLIGGRHQRGIAFVL